MTAKVRVLTRRFDLSVEGETVEQVERLFEVLEERGLSPTVGAGAADAGGQPARVESASTTSVDSGPDVESTRAGLLNPLEAFGSEGLGSSGPDVAAIRAITKRQGDVYVLSPKFPPKADGTERAEDAAMVLLGAFDASGDAFVTGYRLVMALRQTGYTLNRVDKTVDSLRQRGLVMVEGTRRGRRYGLSEAGRAEARKLAAELAAQVGKAVEG